MKHESITRGGIHVLREPTTLPYEGAIEPLIDALDDQRGILCSSQVDDPGLYSRFDLGFVNPPIMITGSDRHFHIEALNVRGQVLLPCLRDALQNDPNLIQITLTDHLCQGEIALTTERFSEEHRSKQPSLFSVLRCLIDRFFDPDEPHLGLYGAFGYDLVFQFETLSQRLPRPDKTRDLVLYLPDEIICVDHPRRLACVYRYDFTFADQSTANLPREGQRQAATHTTSTATRDHKPAEYADCVRLAKAEFKQGNLFEVVTSQTFYEPCNDPPSLIFRRLRAHNPAPYSLLMNLGEEEYLIGTSPEMFVRVTDRRVETRPISGTIARGKNALEDAQNIMTLLTSQKDKAELTMCTDVDRNDKSRICQPGSVRVIGRRQIERYSRLIHTVDHVEGRLRDEFDSLDAFLTHMWVVTVTGAPKVWAIKFIEDHERSPRGWYGGATGYLNFNGDLNTGLTIRTITLNAGVAQVRVGATLLYDSDPDLEEAETELKASAVLQALKSTPESQLSAQSKPAPHIGQGKVILVIDHDDSFVHTLADYFRQTGAEVTTVRAGSVDITALDPRPDLIVLSPGPGRPQDFDLHETIDAAIKQQIPLFGVCLGLQGIVEYFGGHLATLAEPVHGKPSRIRLQPCALFLDFPETIEAARYHSLFASADPFPEPLTITARSEDDVIMAVEHKTLPIHAVQFHPESILSLGDRAGMRIIENVVKCL